MREPARTYRDYTVGWICALQVELAAAIAVLDIEHSMLPLINGDQNTYRLGSINGHNIVIVCLADGETGNNPAAVVAARMALAFPSLRFGVMVGIGGGVPSLPLNDIRLGDVVVSSALGEHGGVIQYDRGKTVEGKDFERTGLLNRPPEVIRQAVSHLRAAYTLGRGRLAEYLAEIVSKHSIFSPPASNSGEQDLLFDPDYEHQPAFNCSTCELCDATKAVQRPLRLSNPNVHYGVIASGNQVMRNGLQRDRISREVGGVLCFEMEAGGLMNHFSCLVIRGICDYSDSHKNKSWQPYAAAAAAAYTKELLNMIMPATHDQPQMIAEFLDEKAHSNLESPSLDRTQPIAQAPIKKIQGGSEHVTSSKREHISISSIIKAVFKPPRGRFVKAAECGDITTVSKILNNEVQSLQLDQELVNKALIAVSSNEIREGEQISVIRFLVNKNAELECKDDQYGRTPLIWAISVGREDIVKELLHQRVLIDARDEDEGWTPLIWAICWGNETVIKLTMSWGANLEATDMKRKRTPLSWAARKGAHAIVELLLQKNLTPLEAQDKDGLTPLAIAFMDQHEAAARVLIKYGANTNFKFQSGLPLLISAVMAGDETFVRLLVQNGADVECTYTDGMTPLSVAAREGHLAVAKTLINNGAPLETKDARGRTALLWATGCSCADVVELLVKGGANYNIADNQGHTVRYWAELTEDERIIELVSGHTEIKHGLGSFL